MRSRCTGRYRISVESTCLRPGLNRGPSVYKTDALPLSHTGENLIITTIIVKNTHLICSIVACITMVHRALVNRYVNRLTCLHLTKLVTRRNKTISATHAEYSSEYRLSCLSPDLQIYRAIVDRPSYLSPFSRPVPVFNCLSHHDTAMIGSSAVFRCVTDRMLADLQWLSQAPEHS